ncbi:MAG: Gldg family protein [Clostridia bacterium]|nr:Gldg family protein [Clostridia bacterium]
MSVVFIKEFKALIRSLRGIISITVFTLATGIIFTANNLNLAYPSIDAVIASFSLVAAVIIPIVSCFAIRGDRKSASDTFYATLPLTRAQIIFGKLAANTVLFLIPTGVICLYPIILGFFGDPSYMYSYVSILFLIVFEVFVISLCMMLASLFKKIWIVLISVYSVLVILFLLGSFAILLPKPIELVCRFISPFRRFDPIVYGKLDISSLAFYLLLSALFVFVCIKYYSVKKTFTREKFKLSLSCIVLALVTVAISVAAAFLPSTLRWADVSASKLYGISNGTKQFVDSIDEDVTLYLIDTDTKEEKLVSFIERYCDRSPRLKLERVDTSKDTEFRSKYGFNDSANLSYCIVVESEKRNRIISADELFVWYNASYPDLGYMSAATLQYRISALESMLAQNSAYYSQMSESDKEQYNSYMTMYQSLYYMSARYLDAQNVISQAIDYVTADVIPTFYFATGHGEKNTTSGPLDLTEVDKIPSEASMILINTPDRDYSDAEVDMLIEYMNNGGRVVMFTNESNNEMPNLLRLAESVGLSVDSNALDDGEENIVTATIHTSSGVFSAMASSEKLTLDMTGASSIVANEASTAYKYSPLFSLDIEEQVEIDDGEGGKKTENKVVTKNLGVVASKENEPVFMWISGSDTFNRSATNIPEEEREQYIIATQCLQYIVAATNRTFVSSLDKATPAEYDVSTPLTLEEGDVALLGTVVIGVIPFAILAAGLFCVYLRKKRGRPTA